MITPEMIPDEVVEAAARTYAYYECYTWGSSGLRHDGLRESARAAIAAALNAWPGAKPKLDGRYFLLPLPQEK